LWWTFTKHCKLWSIFFIPFCDWNVFMIFLFSVVRYVFSASRNFSFLRFLLFVSVRIPFNALIVSFLSYNSYAFSLSIFLCCFFMIIFVRERLLDNMLESANDAHFMNARAYYKYPSLKFYTQLFTWSVIGPKLTSRTLNTQ
jgi:hypothetical protein